MTTTGSDNLSNGSTTQERFAGQSRRGRRDAVAAGPTATDLTTGDSAGQSLGSADITSRSPVLPSLMRGLTEPVFPSGDWSTPQESLAEHPLLRGLLLELPSKAAPPSPEWLDRWFEAARSILELLYVQGASRSR